jgi:hypothetical protein
MIDQIIWKEQGMRKRIGPNERAILNKILKRCHKFRVFIQHKKKNETYFNDLLINDLRQAGLEMKDRRIPKARFVGETFRPDCYVRGRGKIPICAVECKKLTDDSAKALWRAGLSQAILYSHFYKSVILVFYDYTKQNSYYATFSAKKSIEARFIDALRKAFHIHVVVIRAEH